MSGVLSGAALTAEFEIKAANLLTWRGIVRLAAEPIFYSAFVVTALASRGGAVQTDLAAFLAVGVIGIQCVRMMTQVIFRWTLERKWSLGSLKLSSGVPRVGYYVGMLFVPLVSLMFQVLCVLMVVFFITSFQLELQVLPLIAGVSICGLFWSAVGCLITAIIKSYKTRDFVVAMMFTPLMFSAPTLYSLEQVPQFLRAIAAANPLTYQLEFLRSVADGEWVVSQTAIVLAMTIAMVLIGYVSTGRMRTVSNEG
ncbi:ABC transporter permease [Demequina sediminicola]|uniref:ABC transporter permease n=1 Tax=Demequina sediminicola TaxID=1095026 RepID=UPI000785A487|nr:ABC transporter permease [Demequina sediminicola]